MSQTSRNFHAHGGNEWVIGGKLTFLPGAIVEGIEGLLDISESIEVAIPSVANSEATTVAALREDFNRLLTALRASGLMATADDQPIANAPVDETDS